MSRCRIRVCPVRLRNHDPLLSCDKILVVGYRAECVCGWRGGRRDTVRLARDEGAAHRHAG